MKRKGIILLALLLFVCLLPMTVSANSAQPPSLVVIMKNAPEDVAVFLMTEDSAMEIGKMVVAWESYFVFYSRC